MRNEPLIAECAFGWGQVFRLYQNYLDIRGTCYPLADLTHVHPVYQRVLGISSVRLELRFGKKKVILRGIAAMKDAQVVVEYLTSQYLGRTGADKAWSRTREDEDQSKREKREMAAQICGMAVEIFPRCLSGAPFFGRVQ